MNKRPTLRDIARLANVSYVTVSLALRNHPKISTATKEKVKAIAQKLDYRPDPLLSAFMVYRRSIRGHGHHQTLAWINSIDATGSRRGYGEYWAGALERAEELGYALEEFRLADLAMHSRRLNRILRTRGIQGLLIAPVPNHPIELDLDWDLFSSLAFGYSLTRPQLHVVTNAQYRSSIIATEALRAHGYRRIGFVMGEGFDRRTGRNFSSGFFAAQRDFRPTDVIPMLIVDSEHDLPQGPKKFAAWYQRYKPDVIMSESNRVQSWTQQFKLDPEGRFRLAVLALLDLQSPYAGIFQNGPLIGRTAVDLLVGMLHRNERGIPQTPLYTLVEGQWVDGPSAPPLKKAASATQAARYG